jgi:phytoene desaturase
MPATKKIVVIGAGLGGLAAAIRLARAGHHVEIWERHHTPGGKVREHRADGYRWDMGPSLLTMPHVLHDLFQSAGRRTADYLDLRRLKTTCRYFWSDGTRIDEDDAFWSRSDVARFLDYAKGIYELSGAAFLNHPPAQFWRAFSARDFSKLRHLPKIATFRTLASVVDDYFEDPKLRQLFYRFATYNGSSPYLTPATFNIIPYVEAAFGGWYVGDGMARLPEALETLAHEAGVKILYGTTACSWNEGTLRAENGSVSSPDAVICNGDVITSRLGIFEAIEHPSARRALRKPPLSCSGLVMLLGIERRYGQLAHHNIFFSDNYEEEFYRIFERRELPDEPTIYISITARSDLHHAPPGCDNYFVLVNAPSGAFNPKHFDAYAMEAYLRLVMKRLESFGLTDLRRHLRYSHLFTPIDFAKRDLAYGGSLYGWASHSIRAALFRPPLRHPVDPRVFFVGGTTHPGGGIPLVLLSGKMAAGAVG